MVLGVMWIILQYGDAEGLNIRFSGKSFAMYFPFEILVQNSRKFYSISALMIFILLIPMTHTFTLTRKVRKWRKQVYKHV